MSVEMKKFEELQEEGKRLAAKGRLYESLHKFEEARKIKETPKVLQRIQKLKDFIEKNAKEDCSTENPPQNAVVKSSETNLPVSGTGSDVMPEDTQNVLNQIQNTKVIHNEIKRAVPTDPAHLSPEELERFKELKKSAIDLSYDGKFEEARAAFDRALRLCNCPKVKKFIQEVEVIASQHGSKLKEFQMLTDSGTKLASAKKPTESLKKLKDAFAVCPTPKVSKMISILEKTPRPRTSSTDPADLSPEQQARFKSLYERAKTDAREGRLQGALDALLEAKSVCPTDRILKRIRELQEHLKNSVSEAEEDDDKMVAVGDGFYIFHDIYEKLYPYQREGIAWMWQLFQKGKGGVLGDDMGLGKTFQVIAFLSGLIDAEKIKHVLIIMPVSLLPNWEREFNKWCPGISVCIFHGGTKREKERNILRVQRRGHVLLTSYGMVLNSVDNLTLFEGERFIWDYVILDEGHKIKNPTKTTKAVHDLPSKNRLVLTGTPIQNNLRELWSLYDFAHKGTLLGSLKTFKMQYENTITRAREKDATVGEKRLGTEMAENLKMLIKPYFLRRTKTEVWGKPDGEMGSLEQEMERMKISNKLSTRKNDLIVWICMSDVQCDIYKDFSHSEAVKAILVSKRSPLVELTVLKKICDHPRLLSHRACLQLGLNGELKEEDMHRELSDESSYASSIENVTDETLITESGKMKFLISLLHNLRENGHRTLVFSLSRKILDMVHRILVNRNWKVIRIDGTISKIDERERRIQLFQKDSSYSVFLLTTQVGGVGITLTAADRVVIYDPSWNPATDAQAVDRAYRIGQQKNVVVYRLITCGTVEEKIYRRQIFKDSITKQTTCSSADPYRYFSKQELFELFTLDNPKYSATQVQLSGLHANQRHSDVSLDEHIAFMHSLDIFGISDHDLMFSRHIEDETEDNDEAGVSHDFIKKQVAVAQQLISAEASVVEEGMRLAGTYSRPFAEPIPSFKRNLVKDAYKAPSVIENQAFPSARSAFNFNLSANAPTPMRLILNKLQHHSALERSPVQSFENFHESPSKIEVIDLEDDYHESVIKSEKQRENSPFRRRLEDASTHERVSTSRKYEPLALERNIVQAPGAGDTSVLVDKPRHFRRIVPSRDDSDSEDVAEEDTVFLNSSKRVKDGSREGFSSEPSSKSEGIIGGEAGTSLNESKFENDTWFTPSEGEVEVHSSECLSSERSPKADEILGGGAGTSLNDSSSRSENDTPSAFAPSEGEVRVHSSECLSSEPSPKADEILCGEAGTSSNDSSSRSENDTPSAFAPSEGAVKVHSSECLSSEPSPKADEILGAEASTSLNDSSSSLENGELYGFGPSEMESASSICLEEKTVSLLESGVASLMQSPQEKRGVTSPTCSLAESSMEKAATGCPVNSLFQLNSPTKERVNALAMNSSLESEASASSNNVSNLQESESSGISQAVNSPLENDAVALADVNNLPESESSGVSADGNCSSERSVVSVEANSPLDRKESIASVELNTPTKSEAGSDDERVYSSLAQNRASSVSVKINDLPKKDLNSPLSPTINSPDGPTDKIKSSSPYKNIPYFEMDGIPVDVRLLEDLSFDDKPFIVRSSRKSCAKPKQSIYESDSSHKTSCASSANNSEDEILVVSDLEDRSRPETGDEDSMSFVPSSIPNSPYHPSLPRASPRRITPLKLRKNCHSPRDKAFAKALASSPLLRPDGLSAKDETLVHLDDSPVAFAQKRGRKNVISSEDSEDERGSFSDSVEY